MKLYFLVDKMSPEMKAIREVLPMLGCTDDADGIPVELKKIPEGLKITTDDKGYTIGYGSRSALIRAVGLLVETLAKTKKVNIEEKPRFDTLGTMPDHSRNAVQRIDTLQKFIRMTALMGFNAMMLYTEDTYEIEGEPHFGYMRGGLTKQKIKTLDNYASLMGIELVPCIQTLAHMPMIFQWKEYSPMLDCADILIAENKDVYALIDKMLDTCAENFTSRRINIGMDEAWLLGSGAYAKQNGYKPRPEIMKNHLKIVSEKCRERGLNPEMWSDMFFRVQSKTNNYYDMDLKKMPKSIIDSVPDNVTLVYWDYYSVDKARYDHMFERHLEFKSPVGFAGGACNWYGVVPLATFAVNSSRVALESAIRHGIKQAWVTMWNDDAANCSIFGTLPTLQVYAESCWSGDNSDKACERRMKTCTGCSFKDVMDMEQPENIPNRDPKFGECIMNPTKYMFYQDVLSGKFDAHIPECCPEHFAEKAKLMKKLGNRNPELKYVFNTLEALCSALELKCDLGVKLKEAYDAKDNELLSELANKRIPETVKRVNKYFEALRTQWLIENRPFGFEVMDLRLGGLMQRLNTARFLINRYLKGETPTIPELEVERIVFDKAYEGTFIPHIHRHFRMYTSNVTQ